MAMAVRPNNSILLLLSTSHISGSYTSSQSNGYSGGRSNGYSGGSGFDSYGAGGDKMANMGAGLQKPNFDLETLPKFEKNFYHEATSVSRRSDREIEEFRAKKEIRVTGKHIPRPVETFEEAGFPGMSHINREHR
jgi:ATP-dependent RNA helicase DDX5/DBP2